MAFFFLAYTLISNLIDPVSSSSETEVEWTPTVGWTQWTCDELTASLCDLSVTSGDFMIRGTNVKYWRYKRTEPLPYGPFLPPLITLHGGPSWPHGYLLPLKQLACRSNREVIFYDQAGCGESSLPTEANVTSAADYSHLLTTSYYSEEELPALIQHLKLDRYHILGHSWGTILAQLFALNSNNTSGLASLVLSGPLSDAQRYIEAQWDEQEGNLGSLPPFMQERIHDLEQKHLYQSPEYESLDEILTTYFTLRTAPAPDCFTESASGLNADIYVGMQGASEFTISGVLGDLNITSRLQEIDVPVLLTSGKFDTMRPSIVKTMQRQMKISERKLFPHSGHVSMIDDAAMMNDVVADFLGRVELALSDKTDGTFSPKIWEEEDSHKNDESMLDFIDSPPQWLVFCLTTLFAFILGMIVGNCCNKSKKGYSLIR